MARRSVTKAGQAVLEFMAAAAVVVVAVVTLTLTSANQ